MNFTQTSQAPVEIKFDGYVLAVPKMKNKDWSLFSAHLNRLKVDQLTEGMSDNERRHWMNFYPTLPITMEDLEKSVGSPDGMEFIVSNGILNAKIVGKVNEKGEVENIVNPPVVDKKERLQQIKILKRLGRKMINSVRKPELYDFSMVLASLFDEQLIAQARAAREAKRLAIEAGENVDDDEDEDTQDPSKPNAQEE